MNTIKKYFVELNKHCNGNRHGMSERLLLEFEPVPRVHSPVNVIRYRLRIKLHFCIRRNHIHNGYTLDRNFLRGVLRITLGILRHFPGLDYSCWLSHHGLRVLSGWSCRITWLFPRWCPGMFVLLRLHHIPFVYVCLLQTWTVSLYLA